MAGEEKIVIKTMDRPSKESTKELSEWFLKVFDLAGKNDALEQEMFREIMSSSMLGNGVTSKTLNRKLSVPRSTVIYHLNQFIYSGLVVRKGRRYFLRSNDMTGTVEQLQADMMREFNRLMAFAEKLDQLMEDNTHARRREPRKQ